jgi:hypothetical protein|tara:strand:+ start:61 stop:501 length:441 start_codon:yes stop_codon:yes gene_type:complete
MGKIFGSEKALESAVSGINRGLDALVYTDEEKAQDAALERQKARSMVVEWMGNTTGQKLARRLIAVSITFVWLLQYIAAWGLVVAAIFVDPETGERLKEASALTQEHSDGMTGAIMLILSFYFAAPHMDKIVGPAMERFAKTNKKT